MVPPKIEITDTAIESLQDAIQQVQQRYPQLSAEAISKAIGLWLEGAIESLAEDAAFHCVEGDRSFAINRRGFEVAIKPELLKSEQLAVAA